MDIRVQEEFQSEISNFELFWIPKGNTNTLVISILGMERKKREMKLLRIIISKCQSYG